MGNVIVEPSEAWPVVAAGLGSAVIVAWGALIAAYKQRAADAERLREQLVHDRDMRDLQHLRETLTPIVARALDWDAFTSLHKGLKVEPGESISQHSWTTVIVPLVSEVADVSERLRRDSRTLVILAGPTSPVAFWLKEVANDGDALVHVARLRAEEGRTTPELQAALDGLLTKYGFDHARFVEAANEAVRWGETEAEAEDARPTGEPVRVTGWTELKALTGRK